MISDDEFLNEMEQWVIGSLVFKKEHRERLFALARRGAAVHWKPIEEAPKETGKYLLGWNGHHSGVIQYWPPTYEDDPEWVDESTEFIVPPITHFMPFPPPPKGADE